MNRPALTAAITKLADELTGFTPEIDQAVRSLVATHHESQTYDHIDTATRLTNLAGLNSLLALIALVAEGLAESKPVQSLDDGPRHTAKAALY